MSELLQNENLNNRRSTETIIQPDHDVTDDHIELEYDKDASDQCKHPTHPHMKTAAYVNLLPPEYWKAYGAETIGEGTEDTLNADQANRAINQAFLKRLQELEIGAPNALEPKLETYKDWVSVLQRLNKVLLNDFDEFEKTIEDHLQAHKARSNFAFQRDVTTLVRLIRQAYHHNNWSLADMKFETMTPAFVMGLDENNAHDKAILNKLLKGEYQTRKEQTSFRKKLSATDMNVMALAEEVAEKHDEISRLKQQLCCLEDEIQNAQKKIQLKDDVIRELRWDKKNLNKSLIPENTSNTNLISANGALNDMAPITAGNLLAKSTPTSNSIVRKLNTSESKEMAENLEYLKNQLQEILSTSDWQIENSKNEAERLQEIFVKLEADRTATYGRLKKIKEHLLDILTPNQLEEQNFLLNDNDELFIQAVRDHIESANSARKELSQQVQQLLIEKGETAGKIEALNNINRINCDALKELADLLSSLTNEAFNYNEIYNSNPIYNPFCQAVCSIQAKLSKTIEDLTTQLAAEKQKYRQNELQIAELEKSNDGNAYLQSHIETMRAALAEKDKLITQQNVTIARLSAQTPFLEVDNLKNVCNQLQDTWLTRIENLENELDRSRNAEQQQTRESRKLNDELVETKRKNGELLTQVERLRSLLNDSNENYDNLQKKYETLSKSSETQSKQIQNLDQRIADLQKNLTQDSMETKLLQHQLTTLRQKEAVTNGELKALQDRYIKIEGELGHSNDIITKLKSSMHQKEDQYIRSLKRQQEINNELGNSLKITRDKLDKLRKEHEELSEISAEQAETIDSYNKWKVEQRKADAMTRESIEKYENYVKLLTEQNKSCLERCRSLHENNQILTEEIKRLRASTLSTKPGVYTPMTTSSNNLLVNRLDRLRQTTQRVAQQKLQFNKNTTGQIGMPSTELFLPPNMIIPSVMQQAENVTPNKLKSTETKSNDSNQNTFIKPP